MPSRRGFLRRVGGVAAVGTALGGAAHLDVGFVRTKLGGSFGGGIDLESPNSERFVPPAEFGSYAEQTREAYDAAALPWTTPESLPGEFVGAYAKQVAVVPDERFAVQDAAVLVHRLGDQRGDGGGDDARREDARYRLRLWSAGRLLGKTYDVDPWGHYREDPAFTRLGHAVGAERDAQISADRTLSSGGGRVNVADATVTVPDGRYRTGLEGDTRYRVRWEGFHREAIPLVGTCEVSFAENEARTLEWTFSNGVGIRTPF